MFLLAESRITNSIKNIKFAFFNQIIFNLLKFLNRYIFIMVLSEEYLGLNGLFSNILSILSLAELGVGTSITYSLYKPVAEGNKQKITNLINIFKKAYTIIGLFIGISGIMLTPFIQFFVNEMPDIPYIRIIYVLFVINSASSYIFSYKSTLISTNQKNYIIDMYCLVGQIIISVLQIIFLLTTKSYILYLLIQVIVTLLRNIALSIKAEKMYPFINEIKPTKLDETEKNKLINNIKALIVHKIGAVAVCGTDNILIAKLDSLKIVGVYSNYTLITGTLEMVYGIIFNSISSSIGNLCAVSDKKKSLEYFYNMRFFSFWLYSFSVICLYILIDPFIGMIFGEKYILPRLMVIVVLINYYISGMRKFVSIFKDAYGLFWEDRYKPIIESIINLVFSIILGIKFGGAGVIMGTIISNISTCFWMEPYILFKYGFNENLYKYFIKYFKYTFIALLNLIITVNICNIFMLEGLFGFIIKMFICAVIPNLIFFVIFRKTSEFKYSYNIILNKVLKRKM